MSLRKALRKLSENHTLTSTKMHPISNIGLEFIHITKTGGSAVEVAACRAGIHWGEAHFQSRHKNPHRRYMCGGVFSEWESILISRFIGGVSAWHVPMKYLHPNPYKGFKTFTIVIHPYKRAVSEYYCPWSGYMGPTQNSPETLNAWLQQKLSNIWVAGGNLSISFLPHHEYVFDGDEKVIDHVLRYENLENEFSDLMSLYKLPVYLSERVNVARINSNENLPKLTTADLSEKTKQMIYEYAKRDFELFGYVA